MVATTNTMSLCAVNSYPTSCSITTNLSPVITQTVMPQQNQISTRTAISDEQNYWYQIFIPPPNAVVEPLTETITISSTVTILRSKIRTITTTVTTSPTTVTIIKGKIKALTETITIASTPARLAAKIRDRWRR